MSIWRDDYDICERIWTNYVTSCLLYPGATPRLIQTKYSGCIWHRQSPVSVVTEILCSAQRNSPPSADWCENKDNKKQKHIFDRRRTSNWFFLGTWEQLKDAAITTLSFWYIVIILSLSCCNPAGKPQCWSQTIHKLPRSAVSHTNRRMGDDRYSRQKQTEIDKSAWGLAQFSGFTAASGVFTHAQRDRSCDFHSPLTVWMVCSCIELVTHTCRWPQQTYCTHDKLLIITVGLCILLLAIICSWGF